MQNWSQWMHLMKLEKNSIIKFLRVREWFKVWINKFLIYLLNFEKKNPKICDILMKSIVSNQKNLEFKTVSIKIRKKISKFKTKLVTSNYKSLNYICRMSVYRMKWKTKIISKLIEYTVLIIWTWNWKIHNKKFSV